MSKKRLTFLSSVLAIALLSGCSDKSSETKIPIKSENSTKMAKEKAEAERKAEEARKKAEAERQAAEAKRKAEEEARKRAEAERQAAEAKRKAEEARKKAEAEEARRKARQTSKENDYKSLLSAIDEIRAAKISTGVTKLSNKVKENLNLIVAFLKKYEEVSVKINSYTDSTGSDEKNLEISQKRANNIKNYLVSQGIDESRIEAKGFGETNFINPIHPDSLINRRTEIELNLNLSN